MKKIGFIDYYLDEWHANNYPAFFKETVGEEMEVCYAYGDIDSPTGMTNKEWSEKYNIKLVNSIEELIEKSDYIIVLAPDNPETHLRLSDLPLKSGKSVYVDKTFAPDRASAELIFENADKHGTPCYSSSALYFSDEIKKVKKEGITRIDSIGGGVFEIYAIHQIEPIVYLMGYDVKRVMCLGENKYVSMIIEFSGGRFVQMNHFDEQPFHMTIGYDDNQTDYMKIESDFFKNCIKNMADFFRTENVPVPHEQTLTVISIMEAAKKAKERPFEWVDIN